MRSLRTHVLLVIAALVAGLAAVAAVAAGQAREEHARQVAVRGNELARALAAQLDLWLSLPANGMLRTAAVLASLPPDADTFPALDDALRYQPLFSGLLLVEGDGRVLAAAPRNGLGLDASAQPWMVAARLREGLHWSQVQRQADGRLATWLSLRLEDDHVLGAQLDLSRLDRIAEQAGSDPGSFVAVVDRLGTVVARDRGGEGIDGEDLLALAAAGRDAAWRGRPGIASAAPVPVCGWTVVVFQDRAAAFAGLDRLMRTLGVALAAGGLVAGLLLTYALARLLRPVRELAHQAGRLAAGGEVAPVAARYREFAPAAAAFDAMAAAVAAREDELRRSQGEYRDLVEGAGVAILRLDRTGRILFANGHAGRLFGWDPAALAGRPLVGTILPEHDQSGRSQAARLAAILADPAAHPRSEGEALASDGRRLAVAWSNRALGDGEVLAAGIDVTEQRRGEEAIRALLRGAAGATGDEFFPAAAAALADWSEADVVALWEVHDGRGELLAALGPDGPLPRFCRPLAGTMCAATVEQGFLHLRSGAAARYPGHGPVAGLAVDGYAGIAAHGRDGAVVGLLCFYHRGALELPPLSRAVLEIVASRLAAEITRRRADEGLRRSEEVFRLFMDHLPGAAFILDQRGRTVFTNGGGHGRGPGGAGASSAVLRALTGRATPVEAPVEELAALPVEGGERWFRAIRFPIAQSDGGPLQAGIALDITDSRQALHERELLFDLPLSLLLAVAPDGAIRRANPGWRAILGWEPAALAGMPLADLVEPGEHPALARASAELAAGRRVAGLELHLRRREGGTVAVAWEAAPLEGAQGFLAIGHDVSARREAEARLRQVEKLDALGQLAGGMAHDFNNQLTGILGHCELALRQPLDEAARRHVAAVQTAAQRSAQLTGQMLAFARKGAYRIESVDLDALVDEAAGLLERSLDKRIALIHRRSSSPALVAADAGAMQNAILNLALNARDAMPGGGTLTFATAHRTDDGRAQVELTVADTGCGMPPEVLARIFEPFFTTKGQGKGTGLGLSAVYGTVAAHHGTIAVESRPGHGTVFRLRLPAATATPAAAPAAAAVPAAGGGLHVLLVEDEPHLRELGAEMLADLGHRTTVAADGIEAETLFAADPGSFDLVLLDMIMPHRGGAETFAVLRAIRPDLRVLVTSGYSREQETRSMVAQGARGVLAKPFGFAELARAIDEAMK